MAPWLQVPLVWQTALLLTASNVFMTLVVFVPFVVFYMREPLKLDYLSAGLCILGAVYFIFRAP